MIAVYVRVSSAQQTTASQVDELQRYIASLPSGQTEQAVWYEDHSTGTRMARPGLDSLLEAVRRGEVSKVVVWRLDRLGRTAKGLLNFFDELDSRKVEFHSLRDGIDTDTTMGKLMRTILAGVAQFETEVRSERQRAGLEAIKARNGGKCGWGGSEKGRRIKLTVEVEAMIKNLLLAGNSVGSVARVLGFHWLTVNKVKGRMNNE